MEAADMKMGDFVLASSRDDKLSSYGGGAIQTILKTALENKYVDEVLSFQEKKSRYELNPVIISQMEQIDSLPLSQFSAYHVLGTSNIPKYLQQNLKSGERIAIVAKPCDVRALVELAKRMQINFNDLVILGEICYGKISPKKVKKILDEGQTDASKIVYEMIKNGTYSTLVGGEIKNYTLGDILDLEESCKRCIEREHPLSDISFLVIEVNNVTKTLIHINTEKGLKLLELASAKLNLEEVNENLLSSLRDLEQLKDKAEKYKTEQFKIFDKNSEKDRSSYFKELLKNCRKCGMCIKACPICICVDCNVAKKRKEIDPILYFLLRMGHVGDCCVNCGNCDSVCNFLESGPSLVFHRLSELSKSALNYDPGKNMNAPLPRTKKTMKKG
ncbi:MAG: Coenzyme F420 hydrogenase/dehydrogenase, beta subunit C-terminal domain [Candidatus Jordarchaeaceae archaeon]